MTVKLDTERLDRMIADAPGEFSRIARTSAFAIQGDAAMLAPYDTGALSAGIHVEEKSATLYWVADSVDYGIYQELGFIHYRSGQFIQNPFMVPAVEKERARFNHAIRDFFRR